MRPRNEGITRGSDQREECADGEGQQYTATDARAVGEDISKLHGAAGREMLAEFQKDSQEKHREAYYDSSAFIPKSDHWQGRQRQVSTEVLQLVPDVEAADGDHYGRRCWQQFANDDAADQHGPEDQD